VDGAVGIIAIIDMKISSWFQIYFPKHGSGRQYIRIVVTIIEDDPDNLNIL
jgi:hypothetical protein